MSDHSRLLIVPDTNICASGGTISASPPSQIIQAWREGVVDFALCEPILFELYEVLQRPYFAGRVGWTKRQVTEYVNELGEGSLIVKVKLNVRVSPDDNMLFACAVEAGADYIVSGDKDHVLSVWDYRGVKTINPSDFMAVLTEQRKAA
jgi:putative PIN family toxin of toxin-antitoxin system